MSLPITKRDNAAANMPAGGARPAPAGGVQVIQRFDGEDLQKNNGVLGTGLGAQRDRTHQLVQHQDASGKWQVHVQSLNEGRVNPSQYVFTSNRPVTARDFNNPDSMLSQKAREATDRLNADSNRLPDTAATPTNKPAAKAQATPADRSTWSQKVDYAGYKAIVNNVFKPVGGLLKAVGLPQLDSRVKHATADLDKQAASLGMNTQDKLVKRTDLAVNVMLAYGGGAIGKVGKLAKLPQMAQTAIGLGVVPAVQRIGSDASDDKLNLGTGKRAGIDIAQGAANRRRHRHPGGPAGTGRPNDHSRQRDQDGLAHDRGLGGWARWQRAPEDSARVFGQPGRHGAAKQVGDGRDEERRQRLRRLGCECQPRHTR